MGDIDFEELDRAISAFVSKKPKKVIHALKVDQVDEKIVPEVKASFVEPVVPVPEPVALTQTSHIVAEKTPTAQPSLASRRSAGRFMDVIHPTITNLKNKIETDDHIEEVSSKPQETRADKPVIDTVESIFLTNTMVEKRPLGVAQEPIKQAPKEKQVVSKNDQAVEEKVIFKPVGVTTQSVEAPSSSTLPPNIVPQYKESQPKEVQTIPIYDTNVFSKTNGNQKSGWWLVLWIIGLIILGVGSGLLTYYYILPLI